MICNIHIQELRIPAYHGVLEQERLVGADFLITIDADVDVGDSAFTEDNIEGTVSYVDMIEVVRKQMGIPSNLLEHVAHRIATGLLDSFPQIMGVTVRVDKENPPCGVLASAIGVQIRLRRQSDTGVYY